MKMKYLILAFLALAVMTSCRKAHDLEPTPSVGTINKAKTDTLTSAYQIEFNDATQKVVTSVIDDTLRMVYNENVSLLLPKRGLTLSYAVHLLQDFTKSSLNGVDYVTYDQYNDRNFDWADDNLNNVVLKTVTDTTINGQSLAKIHVQRPFIFSKICTSSASAVAEQKVYLAKLTDTITLSAYVYFGQNYPTYTSSVKVAYVKQ